MEKALRRWCGPSFQQALIKMQEIDWCWTCRDDGVVDGHSSESVHLVGERPGLGPASGALHQQLRGGGEGVLAASHEVNLNTWDVDNIFIKNVLIPSCGQHS